PPRRRNRTAPCTPESGLRRQTPLPTRPGKHAASRLSTYHRLCCKSDVHPGLSSPPRAPPAPPEYWPASPCRRIRHPSVCKCTRPDASKGPAPEPQRAASRSALELNCEQPPAPPRRDTRSQPEIPNRTVPAPDYEIHPTAGAGPPPSAPPDRRDESALRDR